MASSSARLPTGPITQIFYFNIAPDQQLDSPATLAGRQWSKALDILTNQPSVQRLYWGRRLEEPEKVQLHVVWTTLQSAKSFLTTPIYHANLLPLFHTPPQTIRHTTVHHQALQNPFSLLGLPIGTAVYKHAKLAWHEGAWPLWTHVVRYVDGCRGIAGGCVLEEDGGESDDYLVYVAWESVAKHDAYHHTKHFAKHRVILGIGVDGWAEYGHVVFREVRKGKGQGQGARL